MKIGFLCSEKYSKYDGLIENIIECMNKKVSIEKQAIENSKIVLSTRKKYDLYVLFTDDVEDFNLCYSKIKSKNKPILITQNLQESYIRSVIGLVKDIIYSKSNTEVIANRLFNIMVKLDV